jgi:hypothetical protein
MYRAKTEEPDFFELEKTSPLPTLAETKFRLETRKMRRLKEHFESDTIVRSVPIRNAASGSLTIDHFQQVNAQRLALKHAAGSSTEMGDQVSQQAGVNEDQQDKMKPADKSGSPQETVPFRLDQNLMEQHHRAQMMRQADFMEQERFRRMREEQFFYQHQMNRIHTAQHPNSVLGLPYGAMGYIGHPSFNPYMPPPS